MLLSANTAVNAIQDVLDWHCQRTFDVSEQGGPLILLAVLAGVCSQAAQIPISLTVRRSSRLGAVRRQQSALRVQPVAAAAASSQPHHVGSPIARPEQRYAVVVARFNELVTRLLLAGAVDAFERHGLPVENIEVRLRHPPPPPPLPPFQVGL